MVSELLCWWRFTYLQDICTAKNRSPTSQIDLEYLQIVTRNNCHQHPSPKSVTDIYHQHRCCLIARKRKYLNTLVRNIKPSPIWYFAFSQTKLPRAISKPPPKLIKIIKEKYYENAWNLHIKVKIMKCSSLNYTVWFILYGFG